MSTHYPSVITIYVYTQSLHNHNLCFHIITINVYMSQLSYDRVLSRRSMSWWCLLSVTPQITWISGPLLQCPASSLRWKGKNCYGWEYSLIWFIDLLVGEWVFGWIEDGWMDGYIIPSTAWMIGLSLSWSMMKITNNSMNNNISIVVEVIYTKCGAYTLLTAIHSKRCLRSISSSVHIQGMVAVNASSRFTSEEAWQLLVILLVSWLNQMMIQRPRCVMIWCRRWWLWYWCWLAFIRLLRVFKII